MQGPESGVGSAGANGPNMWTRHRSGDLDVGHRYVQPAPKCFERCFLGRPDAAERPGCRLRQPQTFRRGEHVPGHSGIEARDRFHIDADVNVGTIHFGDRQHDDGSGVTQRCSPTRAICSFQRLDFTVIHSAATTAASLDRHEAARSPAKRLSTEYDSGEEAVAVGFVAQPHPAAEFSGLEHVRAARHGSGRQDVDPNARHAVGSSAAEAGAPAMFGAVTSATASGVTGPGPSLLFMIGGRRRCCRRCLSGR